MTDDKNGPKDEPPDHSEEPLTLEEFKRLVKEAQEKGEPIEPLIKRLVISTIDRVKAKAEKGELE